MIAAKKLANQIKIWLVRRGNFIDIHSKVY